MASAISFAATTLAGGALSYPVKHPIWVLTYAGKDITADVSNMAVEVTYSDKEEHLSDELEVTFEDRDRRWQGPWLPTRGALVGGLVGYEGVGSLLDCGIFQIDELELKGPPDSFHLKCIAAGITPSIRTPRSAAYENQTLLQVAQTIAARQGMTVTGLPQSLNVSWARISQRHETDLHFLHRLAIAHNYDFSIRGTQLVFYARTPLEAQAAVVTIDRTQTKTFEFKTRTQQIYKSASVAYHNPRTKQLISAAVSDTTGAPTGDDPHVVTRCETPQQAQLKAASALHDKKKDQVTGRIETEGTVLLVAGVNIAVTGFATFDGNYHIQSSRHRLERSSGYTTEIEVRRL
jgi:phage protein D